MLAPAPRCPALPPLPAQSCPPATAAARRRARPPGCPATAPAGVGWTRGQRDGAGVGRPSTGPCVKTAHRKIPQGRPLLARGMAISRYQPQPLNAIGTLCLLACAQPSSVPNSSSSIASPSSAGAVAASSACAAAAGRRRQGDLGHNSVTAQGRQQGRQLLPLLHFAAHQQASKNSGKWLGLDPKQQRAQLQRRQPRRAVASACGLAWIATSACRSSSAAGRRPAGRGATSQAVALLNSSCSMASSSTACFRSM